MRSQTIAFIILFIISIVSPLQILYTLDRLCLKGVRYFFHTTSRRHTHDPSTGRNTYINYQYTHLILSWLVCVLCFYNPLFLITHSRPRHTRSTTYYTNNNERLPLFRYYYHLIDHNASHCSQLIRWPSHTHIFTRLLNITTPLLYFSLTS